MPIVELPDGRVIDFGDMEPAEIEEWISAQQTGEGMGEAAPSLPGLDTRTAGATAIRYGLPTATAMLSKNIPLTMAAAGVGEYAARTIETRSDEEAMDAREFARNEFNKVLRGGGAALFEGLALKYIAPALTKGFNWASLQGSKLYRRLLLPDEMPPNMQKTLDVLRMFGGKGEVPHAPSFGQMARHEQKMISYLEQVTRSSLLTGKKWAKFDARNVNLISDEVEKIFRAGVDELDDEAFGALLRRMLSTEQNYVKSVQNTLYDAARQRAADSNIRVNLTDLYNYMQRDVGRGALDEIQRVRSVIDDIIEDAGMSMDDIAGWESITPDLAIEIRREVNALANKLRDPAQKRIVTRNVLTRIRDAVDAAFSGDDEALYALKSADDLVGTTAARMQTAIIQKVTKELAANPSAVRAYMIGGGVKRVDRLTDLEKLFTQTYVEGVGKVSTLGRKMFEEKILPPLRFAVLAEAVDPQTNRFVGSKLSRVLSRSRYGKDGDAFLNKLFGSEKVVSKLRDLATALETIEQPEVGSKVWIQLVQGGAILSGITMFGAGEAFESETLKKVGVSTFAVFASPYLLARKLSDPRFLRMIIDGVTHGPSTRPFARMVATIAQANALEHNGYYLKLEAGARKYFSTTKGKALLEGEEPPQEFMQLGP